jgi:hypothetical protein
VGGEPTGLDTALATPRRCDLVDSTTCSARARARWLQCKEGYRSTRDTRRCVLFSGPLFSGEGARFARARVPSTKPRGAAGARRGGPPSRWAGALVSHVRPYAAASLCHSTSRSAFLKSIIDCVKEPHTFVGRGKLLELERKDDLCNTARGHEKLARARSSSHAEPPRLPAPLFRRDGGASDRCGADAATRLTPIRVEDAEAGAGTGRGLAGLRGEVRGEITLDHRTFHLR